MITNNQNSKTEKKKIISLIQPCAEMDWTEATRNQYERRFGPYILGVGVIFL